MQDNSPAGKIMCGRTVWTITCLVAGTSCATLIGAIVKNPGILDGLPAVFVWVLMLGAVFGLGASIYGLGAGILLSRRDKEAARLRAKARTLEEQLAEIESAQLAQRTLIDELATLREVAYVVNIESDFGIITEKVLALIQGLMEPIEGTVFLVDEKDRSLQPFAQHVNGKSLTGRKVTTRSIPNFHPSVFEHQSVVCRVHGQEVHAIVPLKVEEEVLGVLFLVFPTDQRPDYIQAGEFNRNKRALLQEIAQHISLALKTKHLHTEAVVDWLTGLYTRRHFDWQVEAHVDLARREREKFALILMDLDHFKDVNDTYGHPSGDAVLKGVADIVRRSLRKYDTAYRSGGEEMAVLLPRSTLAEGVQIAERLRTRIERHRFKADNGAKLHVTVSIGVAQFRSADRPAALYGRADQRLYEAKECGRNQVVPRAA